MKDLVTFRVARLPARDDRHRVVVASAFPRNPLGAYKVREYDPGEQHSLAQAVSHLVYELIMDQAEETA